MFDHVKQQKQSDMWTGRRGDYSPGLDGWVIKRVEGVSVGC